MKHLVAGSMLGLALTTGCTGPDGLEPTATTTSSVVVCGSAPLQPPAGDSIRVLSLNAQLLSPWFSMPSPDLGLPANAMTNEKAQQFAAVLALGTFDVIGINEAWDEDDGKDVLVDSLCPTYPNFVRSVDAGQVTEERPEDAGLMVFSKLPFLPLPDHAFVSDDSESSLGDDSDRIAFTRFDSCSGVDCLASKGALMVRLGHPASGRVLNFVTTHMQADAGEEAARAEQMLQIRGRCETGLASPPNLITTTLGLPLGPQAGLCAWPNTEWLALTGDVNVPGEGAVRASVHATTATPASGPPEWEAQIGGFVDAFATNRWALYDAWAETTSPPDLGITHQGDASRLDYILASRRSTPPASTAPGPDLCVQRIWNPPELDGISDHQPVAADLNRMAPQCNPRLARVVQPHEMTVPGKAKSAITLQSTLSFPGSMQWFRVDEPGTYTFALTGAPASSGLAFEVLRADNLSVPLGGALDLGSDGIATCTPDAFGRPVCSRAAGTKFVIPQAPFFIRVFSNDRTFSGSYGLTVYRYKCDSPSEPCAVLPHAPHAFKFPPANTPLNADDAAWFQVDIAEQADSGAMQALRFHVDHTGAGAWVAPSLRIFNATGTAELTEIDSAPISGQQAMLNPAGKQRVFRLAGARTNQRVLLRVRRSDVTKALAVKPGWQTDLVLVGALAQSSTKLVCEDETNPEDGSDEIRMRIKRDGTWFGGGTGDFDCNNTPHSRSWDGRIGVVRAVSQVRLRLLEEDEWSSGGDDEVSQVATVNLPPMESELVENQSHVIHWTFAGGAYRFQFLVGKWRE